MATKAPPKDGQKADMDRPQFDLTRYTWKESKETARIAHKLSRANAKCQDETLSDEEFEEALDELDRQFDALAGAITKRLLSVPRDWLTPIAPPDLDWSDPKSLDFLQSHRMADLREAMQAATNPEAVSGN